MKVWALILWHILLYALLHVCPLLVQQKASTSRPWKYMNNMERILTKSLKSVNTLYNHLISFCAGNGGPDCVVW